jgi:outer membrane assembly lipoprotein YfiO
MTITRKFFYITFLMALLAVGSLCAYAAEENMIWDGEQWVKAKPPEPGTPEGDLAEISALIEEGENKKALKAVDRFLISHAASPVCEEAISLAGKAQINRGRYWDAYKWYERQIMNYPNGAFFERALDREYTIADAFLNGKKRRALKIFKVSAKEDGIEILLRIAGHAPGSDLAERALLRVADYHFNRQEYDDAIGVYDEFVKTNPQSNRKPYAMLRAAKASLLSFRGVKWDDTPLLNAAVRFRVFAQAYPKAGKKENVVGILTEIRETLAHKVFHSGTFYERTHHTQSAVFYYNKVVQEYPASQWAEKARERLDRFGPIKLEPRFEKTSIGKQTPAMETLQKKPEKKSVSSGQAPQPGVTTAKAKLSQAEQKTTQPDRKAAKGTEPIRLEELSK